MMHHRIATTQLLNILRATHRFQSPSRRIVRPLAINRRSSMPPLAYPEPTVIPPRSTHTATVIVLHGLGDTAAGWVDAARPSLWGAHLPYVKFLLPTAPMQPVTLNLGLPFTSWYDIVSLSAEDSDPDEDGINESYRYISELIEKEIQSGIPSDRIAVAGFSQGGAMSLTMLRSPHKFAGILAMSTYLPVCKDIPIVSDANKGTPVMMTHGTQDTLIAIDYGQQSFNILKEELQNIQFKQYELGHEVSNTLLLEMRAFLESVLPQS